jgi:cyclopropane-fatty-acyl-phospholipid synthase
VLDVGCGWGSFPIDAAREHGARVVGITLSEPQAELARRRVAEADVADRVEIRVAGLLGPGGRLLNHGIARVPHGHPPPGPFLQRYVFPDGEPLPLSRVQLALERAGFLTEHVEGFAADYAETLRHWIRRLDERLADAVRLAGAERVRVWRLYLRAARNSFERRSLSVYQVRCQRT